MFFQGRQAQAAFLAVFLCTQAVYAANNLEICQSAASQSTLISSNDRKSAKELLSRVEKLVRAFEWLKRQAKQDPCLEPFATKLQTALIELQGPMERNVPFLYWKAKFFAALGQTDKSLKIWLSAVEIDTTHILSNYEIAQLFLGNDQKSLALKHFRRLLLEEAQSAEERSVQSTTLDQLISDLENDQSRIQEYVKKLRSRGPLRQREHQMMARMAVRIDAPDEYKAHRFSLDVAERFRLDREIFRKRNNWIELCDLLRRQLQSLKITKQNVDDNFYNDLVKEYVEASRESKSWIDLRKSSEMALKIWPGVVSYQNYQEEALLKGAYLNKNRLKDLQEAAIVNPSSALIQRLMCEEYLLPMIYSGTEVITSPEQLKLAEINVARLHDLAPDDVNAIFWRAYVFSKKKNFKNADLLMVSVLQKIKKPEDLSPALAPVLLWREIARIKEARGFYSEAVDVLNEGLNYVAGGEDRAILQQNLDRIQKFMKQGTAK